MCIFSSCIWYDRRVVTTRLLFSLLMCAGYRYATMVQGIFHSVWLAYWYRDTGCRKKKYWFSDSLLLYNYQFNTHFYLIFYSRRAGWVFTFLFFCHPVKCNAIVPRPFIIFSPQHLYYACQLGPGRYYLYNCRHKPGHYHIVTFLPLNIAQTDNKENFLLILNFGYIIFLHFDIICKKLMDFKLVHRLKMSC